MKNPVLLAGAAVLIAAAALAQTPPTLSQQIAGRLTANDLKADVSFLASDTLQGRGTPSPGLDVAAEFVAAQFRRAGLDPAGDDGYFQTAHYLNVTPNTEGMEFTVETAAGKVTANKAAMALQQAAPVDLSRAAVLKVAALDAAQLRALTPEQVHGKVLVLDLPDAGPVQILSRQLPAILNMQPALLVVLRPGGQPTRTSATLREAAGPAQVPLMLVWDESVRAALGAGKAGPVDALVTAHVAAPASEPVNLRNVVGVMRGSDPALRDTYVLLTAHYDHLGAGPGSRCRADGNDSICNGANDDASGTASVIEIANALAALPQRPKRSIVFIALFGEELGDVGSHYYAAHPVFPLAKTVADLNLEQLGRTDVDGGASVGVVNITGYDYSTLSEFIQKAGTVTGLQVVKDATRNEQYFARSDNQALADAGVPAHTLSVGYMFPEYHRPGDEWPKLDYENLAKVDRTIALAVYDVADSVATPRWNELPATERYRQAWQELQKH